jgi:D-alanyl-lipoteichoic acid acyltransferase DltB (MBOAT superfamily)
MLFGTQLFLLVFLPLVLGGYYLAARAEATLGAAPRKLFLTIASFWFYGYWDYRLLPLLAGSILVNWLFARFYTPQRKYVVTLGVALNLLLLGIFKYANFFADTLAFVFGTQHEPWSIVLPLAISFFTFQQISYLVDRRRGGAPTYSLLDYTLYVAFFPQLIAGPIVRHHEIIGQFPLSPFRDGLSERFARGLTLLVIGLVKKAFLADPLGHVATPFFAMAAGDLPLTFAEAWIAGLAFTLQIYFDFSSYSDMAIGMGLMFGFTLPLNFNSPYQATSIRDLWRRWHMTLTRFMRDYLYTPVALRIPRKYKMLRESTATLLTMTLIGIWHGAAWSYAVFGAMHGVALIVNSRWRKLRFQMPALMGWALTFSFAMFSLVLFRTEDVQVAVSMWAQMLGSGGFDFSVHNLDLDDGLQVPLAAIIAWLAPNSQTLALERLQPLPAVGVAVGVLLAAVLLQVGVGQGFEFIYFQF